MALTDPRTLPRQFPDEIRHPHEADADTGDLLFVRFPHIAGHEIIRAARVELPESRLEPLQLDASPDVITSPDAIMQANSHSECKSIRVWYEAARTRRKVQAGVPLTAKNVLVSGFPEHGCMPLMLQSAATALRAAAIGHAYRDRAGGTGTGTA
jgi:hypothetical protein